MNKETMLDLLNSDLQNEWMHMHFYLYHASAVTGLHREEYKELFLKEAASEMEHVTQFSDLIIGLGGNPKFEPKNFVMETDPLRIISQALAMESEVVKNYVQRLHQAELLAKTYDEVDGTWLQIFLENQIEHSREDVDHFKQILKGI